MLGVIVLVIDETIDKLIKWKSRSVSLKNHRQRPPVTLRAIEAVDIINQQTTTRQFFPLVCYLSTLKPGFRGGGPAYNRAPRFKINRPLTADGSDSGSKAWALNQKQQSSPQ